MRPDLHETGYYALIEGEEASGKSTLAKATVDALKAIGYAALKANEPTPGPIGTLIREAWFAKNRPTDGHSRDLIRPEAFPYLFLADRIDHMAAVVNPCLANGGIVVQDRGFLSSLVHQGGAGDWTWLLALHTQVRKPDRIFILDVPLPLLVARRKQRGDHTNSFSLDDMTVRRQLYLNAQERLHGTPVTVLNGAEPIPVLVEEILRMMGVEETPHATRDRQ